MLYVFLVRFLVGLLCEEKRRLYLYFLLDGVLVFTGPVVVRLLEERVPPSMRGGDRLEVGRPLVGRFVELVYHIIIKLFSAKSCNAILYSLQPLSD